jgi:hypothetical protein
VFIRDRDHAFDTVATRVDYGPRGSRDKATAAGSTWQNGFAEG